MVSDLDSIESGLKDGTYKIDNLTKSLDKLSMTQGDLRGPFNDFNRADRGGGPRRGRRVIQEPRPAERLRDALSSSLASSMP